MKLAAAVAINDQRFLTQHQEFMSRHFPSATSNNSVYDEADETWVFTRNGIEIAAHFSLWYENTPHHTGHRIGKVGYIGHFYADDREMGARVLQTATKKLKDRGCEIAIGPMDGNTWRNYRLVVESNGDAPFPMEPHNPAEYPGYFVENGFEVLATYSSSILPVMEEFNQTERTGIADGITIRTIDVDSFEDELRRLFKVSDNSFQMNFLYSPISEEEFVERYVNYKRYVVPQLILIAERSGDLLAERNGEPVGFVFAMPDPSNGERVILKTLGRIDDPSLKGLGLRLVHECHKNAAQLGFKTMIHALYKDDNRSGTFSTADGATILRRYALYFKRI